MFSTSTWTRRQRPGAGSELRPDANLSAEPAPRPAPSPTPRPDPMTHGWMADKGVQYARQRTPSRPGHEQ
eukprot:5292429-Prymnesium_polylepis.1